MFYDIVDDVVVVDRVVVDMKKKRQGLEGATDSKSLHIEKKRIKLHHRLRVEDLAHSRVDSPKITDPEAITK